MKLSVGANSMSSVTVPFEIAGPVMCKGTLLDRLTVEKVKENEKNALPSEKPAGPAARLLLIKQASPALCRATHTKPIRSGSGVTL